MLRSLRIPALFALVLAAPQLALAHAVLVSSTPQAGQVVHAGSLHVELKFNSRVDGPRCTLSLLAPDGNATQLQLATQGAPDSIAAEVPELHQGAYTLRWQALASDGHITRGQIAFRVE